MHQIHVCTIHVSRTNPEKHSPDDNTNITQEGITNTQERHINFSKTQHMLLCVSMQGTHYTIKLSFSLICCVEWKKQQKKFYY